MTHRALAMIPGPPPGIFADDRTAASDHRSSHEGDLPSTAPSGDETAARSLTYRDFAAALKGALRDFHSTDLLARNLLLRSGIGRLPGSAGPLDLKALLSETVGTLFGN